MPVARRISKHRFLQLPADPGAVTILFNGRQISARADDTVSSALLAAGVTTLSRSFKYHRRRGLYDNFGLGAESLLEIDGTPNVQADTTPVRQGMRVRTQNAWPSVETDVMAVNDRLVPLLPNGFYYKMFHRPRWAWPLFERVLRGAAGIGRIAVDRSGAQPRYEKRYRFPDVCVVGSGPAGLAAAQAAMEAGRRVLLLESDGALGGHSRHTITNVTGCEQSELNGLPEYQAVAKLGQAVASHDHVEVLTGTTAFGIYEDNLVAAQSGTDLYKIRASTVVLAPGATDRHLVFENNDKPGIMTGRGVERLIALHAVRPARRAVVVTAHAGGYHTARLLHGAGTEVVAIVDARAQPPAEDTRLAGELDIPLHTGQTIHAAHGSRRVTAVTFGSIDGVVAGGRVACDLAVLAVGYKPQLALLSMGLTRPAWDTERDVFRVLDLPGGTHAAGEVNGPASFAALYGEGRAAGQAAAHGESAVPGHRAAADVIAALPPDIEAGGTRHFICKCMDVTRKEARASIAEGFDQVETLKRYSSMGMGPCQGKTCYEAVARLAAVDTGRDAGAAETTTIRFPAVPVSFGVLAGRAPHLVPKRRTAMHDCHVQAGARLLDAGQWKRPHSYGDVQREALAVRQRLGLIDVSTLGKVGISGPDALDFMHFMFPGTFRKLTVGVTRYSIMIGEDGILFEDGTLSHVDPGEYYLSTTTGNQDAIVARLRWWAETMGSRVHLANLGPVLAAVNLAGPRSRELLQGLVDIDVSHDAFPYMQNRRAHIAGVPCRLFRIGFTGELSYEVHFPSEYGETMWQYLLEAGAAFDLQPFGVETQRVLRLEKGHLLPGIDTDALSNPSEAGVGFTVKDDKPDFIGRAFLRLFKARGIENRLVPYQLAPGAPIPDDGVAVLDRGRIVGRVTSSRFSPTLGRGVGLCWVPRSMATSGGSASIRLADGRDIQAEILAHGAYDPEGSRLLS
jgi:sarcosine oxidase subunit alpha